MNYTIHQLKIFLKVVQTQSVTKTSAALFMTQPAVSIQLKNFQNQFDIPLTEVVGRRLYITDFGREVAVIAEQAIHELEKINHLRQAYKGILSGRFSLSVASTGKYIIPYFLNDFVAQHPSIDLKLDVTNKTKVVKSLRNNEVDFALISVIPDKLVLEEELLLDNKLYLVGSTSDKEEDKPLIYRESGSATRAAMESYFKRLEGKQRKRLELTSNEAVKQAVIAGMGYSIMPLIGMKNELLNQQIYIIPSPELPIQTEWRLVWLKGKKFSPVSQAFLDYTRREKQRILATHFAWYLSY